jgi:hypothetical protein
VKVCARIASCPNPANSRLAHGECIPISRGSGVAPHTSRIPFGVVLNFCSKRHHHEAGDVDFGMRHVAFVDMSTLLNEAKVIALTSNGL